MAPISSIQQGDVLTVRTYKTVGVARLAWANTYEIENVGQFYRSRNCATGIADTGQYLLRSFES